MARFRRNLPRGTAFGALGVFAGLLLMLMGVPLASLLVFGLLLMCPLLMAGMHMRAPHRGDHGASSDVEQRPDRGGPPRAVPTDRDPR
jgi:hypothetical protein